MGDLPVLLNPLILEKVLSYSDHNDLANHRLVCKTWYDVTLTRWRSTSTLTILGNLEPPGSQRLDPCKRKIVNTSEGSSTDSSNSNCDFMKFGTKPFTRFKLKRFEFDGKFQFPEFWEIIGPLMTHVHLDECVFPWKLWPGYLQELVDIIFQLTPNLEGFKMTRTVFPPGRFALMGCPSHWVERNILNKNFKARPKPTVKEFFVDGKLPFHLGDLLEYFPNLERLTFHNFHSRSLRITLAELERMERKLPLKHLDILHDPESDGRSFYNVTVMKARDRWKRDFRFAEDFGKHVFPLKSLSLGTCSGNIRNFMGAVRKILERYSTEAGGNLETLKLYAAPFDNPVPRLTLTSAMTMESLVELELWGNCVGSLCFLEWMPNLKRLYINTTCFEMWDKMPEIREGTDAHPRKRKFVTHFRDDMVQNALKISAGRMEHFVAQNLTDFHVSLEFGVESLKTLTKWMPNLSSFSSVLNNETIRVVFEHWKDLRDLKCLYWSTVDDEGIAGSGSRSNAGTESPPKKRIKLETDPLIEKEVLNITRLTKLQTFKYEAYCGQGKLGDRSAVEGFLKMRILQTLDICVSPQMSQRIETCLKEAIRNVKIDRNYDEKDREAHEGECCKRLEFLCMSVKGVMPKEISKYPEETLMNSEDQPRRSRWKKAASV